jgi:predicted O-methyltransferase YrrM
MVPENGTIVEIGSLFGKSSTAMAMTNRTAKIYCVDLFPENLTPNHGEFNYGVGYPEPKKVYDVDKIFDENVKKFNNIIKIKGMSPGDILDIDFGQIDLFFLDASHTNPNDWDNIEYFLPKIKKGGIISGHDYIPTQFPDVIENVKRLEKLLGTTATLYEGSSVWSMIVSEYKF